MMSEKKSRNAKTKNYIINVNCYTWINNSHGLFDYESENFYKKCFKIKCLYNYYYILKDDINVEIKNEEEINKVVLNKTNLKLICKIKYMNNSYQLIPCIDSLYNGVNNSVAGNNVKGASARSATGGCYSVAFNSANNNTSTNNTSSANNNSHNNNNNNSTNNNDNIDRTNNDNSNNNNNNNNNNSNTDNNINTNNNNINSSANNDINTNNNIGVRNNISGTNNIDSRREEANENSTENDMDNFWVIVKYLKNKSSVLHEDDVLKLGRVKLKIKKIITTAQQEEEYNKSISPFDEAECETVAPDAEHYLSRHLTEERNIVRTNFANSLNEQTRENNRTINNNGSNSNNNNNFPSENRNMCFNCDSINDHNNNNENNTLVLNIHDPLTVSTIHINSPMNEQVDGQQHRNGEEIQNGMNHITNRGEDKTQEFYSNELIGLTLNGHSARTMNNFENQGATNLLHKDEMKNLQNCINDSAGKEKDGVSHQNHHTNSNSLFINTENQTDFNINTSERVNCCSKGQFSFNHCTRGEGVNEKEMNLNKPEITDPSQNAENSGKNDNTGGGAGGGAGGFFFNYFSNAGWDKSNFTENSVDMTAAKMESKKEPSQNKRLLKSILSKTMAEENKYESVANDGVSKENANANEQIKTTCLKKEGNEEMKQAGNEENNAENKRTAGKDHRGPVVASELENVVKNDNINGEIGVENIGVLRETRWGSEIRGAVSKKNNNNNKKRTNCENESFNQKRNGEYSIHLKENVIKFRKSYSLASMNNCRICLCEYDDVSNPLISPCRCKGSMKYVHLNCLRIWMRGRLNVRSDSPSISFFWKQLNCELCKFPYPTYVNVQNKHLELYEIPKLELPYIVIELMNDRNKGFYIVSLANTKFVRMGRGHDSDVRVNDISVSRFHAMIKFQNGKFFIEDCKSKFGTLIQIRKPVFFNIRKNKFIALQIGRTVMYVYMKRKNWIFLPVCLKLSKTQDDDVSILDNFSSKLLVDNNVHLSNNNFEYDRANNEMPGYENGNQVHPMRFQEGGQISNENNSRPQNENSVSDNNRLHNVDNDNTQLRNITMTSQSAIYSESHLQASSNFRETSYTERYTDNAQLVNAEPNENEQDPEVQSHSPQGRNIYMIRSRQSDRRGSDTQGVTTNHPNN